MPNLAPGIHRQRMAAEFRHPDVITKPAIEDFSDVLKAAMGMRVIDLSISMADGFGLGAGCHWDFSGWSLMCWDGTPDDEGPFATLDLHSCKPYDPHTVLAVITGQFHPTKLVWGLVLPEFAR